MLKTEDVDKTKRNNDEEKLFALQYLYEIEFVFESNEFFFLGSYFCKRCKRQNNNKYRHTK